MKHRSLIRLLAVLCVLALLLAAGCAKKPETPTSNVTETTAETPAGTETAPAEEAPASEPSETEQPQEPAEAAEPAEPEEPQEPEEPEVPGPAQPRELSEEELEELNEELFWEYNGFLGCVYACPEEIVWDDVLHNGLGLTVEATEELTQRFEEERGWPVNGWLVLIPAEAADAYMRETTGLGLDDAWCPLHWLYLEDEQLYCLDTVESAYYGNPFTAGTEQDGVYRLQYAGMDFMGRDTEMVLTVQNTGSGFRFLSNLPADADPEAPLYGPFGWVLRRYVQELMWYVPDAEELEALGLSPFCSLYSQWPAADNLERLSFFGYAFKDLNGDGKQELLIGATSADFGAEYVFQVYADRYGSQLLAYDSPAFTALRLLADGRLGLSMQENVYYAVKQILWLDEDGQFYLDDAIEMYGNNTGVTDCQAITPEGDWEEVDFSVFEAFDPHADAVTVDWIGLDTLVEGLLD